MRSSRFLVLIGAIVAVSVGVAVGAPLLVNHGGKVLTAPQVSGIYLGDYWSTAQGASDALHTDTFIQTWLSGPSVTGVLAQYGVGSASFASSVKVAATSSLQFTDADARALVQQQIAAGRVVSGDQTIQVIYLPPGTVLSLQGTTSQNRLGAYHSSYHDPGTGKPVYYAVVVYSQGTNGIDFNGNPQDNISIMTSFALAGAMTDPDLGDVTLRAAAQGTLGWRDDTLGEIGDIAFALSTDPALGDVWVVQNGFAVELLWSNKDGKLTAGGTSASTGTGTTTGTGTSVSTTPATTGTQATSSVLTVSPASQNVQPGASVTYTVSTAASAADTLALFVSGLPANVTGTFAQTSITPGGTTTLTIAVAAGAANATTTFTVTGTGATSTQSASATLIVGTGTAVTPAATTVVPTADFVLSVTPDTQTIAAGGEVIRFTISSQPTFRPPTRITLQAQHLPHGINAYLSPRVITTGQSATLTLLAHQDPPRGSHDITIKGSSRRGVQRITVTIVINRPRD